MGLAAHYRSISATAERRIWRAFELTGARVQPDAEREFKKAVSDALTDLMLEPPLDEGEADGLKDTKA